MELTFLEAKEPLTKSFDLDDQGNLIKSSYPVVKNFKSHAIQISTIEDLHTAMVQHASKYHCLLKGELQRPLEWESRAGSTNAHSETSFIIFDLDLDLGHNTPEEFMAHLAKHYPQYHNVSYIVQYSASYMINAPTPLKCHIAMLCDPIAAPMLKQHLTDINLKLYSEKLKLTKTNNALSWGVDVTACQNDKLIYIAPPILDNPNIQDLHTGDRIKLVKKKRASVAINEVVIPTSEALKNQSNALINTLREAQGLTKRKSFTYKFLGSQSYLPVSDAASITGMKTDRGFVYFNLNGGDSWAYYHPEGKPEFVYSFKGDGPYLTRELLPDYWAEVKQQQNTQESLRTASVAARLQGKKVFLAFRNFKESRYMNGWYDPANNIVELRYCSKDQLEDFLKSNNQPVPDYYMDWNVIYDPTVPLHPYEPIDFDKRVINTFVPSSYMMIQMSPLQKKITQCPPTIQRLLESLCGTDQDTIDRWHNHLAYILRTRKKTRIAWVFQGVEGTGKGVLFYEILRPLLGVENTVMIRFEELEERYTERFERALWATVDEVDMSEHPKKLQIMANLKNQITEPTLSIRRMYSVAHEEPNFTNYGFNSNMRKEVMVASMHDRRLNFMPYQPLPIKFSDKDIATIRAELNDYAMFLWQLQIDESVISVPIENEARAQATENSRSSIDMIADMILSGDIVGLWDALPHDPNALDIQMSIRYQAYKNLMDDLIRTKRNKLRREELLIIFQYNIGNIPVTPAKFTRFCGHHGLNIVPLNLDNKTFRGVQVNDWYAPEEWWAEREAELNTPPLTLIKKDAA
jgi:hypothetical protein